MLLSFLLTIAFWQNCFFSFDVTIRLSPVTTFQIHFFFKDNRIHRGCLTDPDDSRLLCEQNNNNKKNLCIKCDKSGCNNVPRVRAPSISCVHCNKSVECGYGFLRKDATPCVKQVQLGSIESCYVHYNIGKFQAFKSIFKWFKNQINHTSLLRRRLGWTRMYTWRWQRLKWKWAYQIIPMHEIGLQQRQRSTFVLCVLRKWFGWQVCSHRWSWSARK